MFTDPHQPSLAQYLRTRRHIRAPDKILFSRGERRQVNGLRREEVAELAGLSPEYYVRLEQGRGHLPSNQVLEALSRALDVGEPGFAYMRRLAHGVQCRHVISSDEVVVDTAQLLTLWKNTPAYVVDPNLDVIASNYMAEILGGGAFDVGKNVALGIFGNASGEERHNWPQAAVSIASWLRMSMRANDARAQEIQGLLVQDELFRSVWSRFEVAPLTIGKTYHRIGALEALPFEYVAVEVSGAPGYLMVTYRVPRGTEAEAALGLGRQLRLAAVRT